MWGLTVIVLTGTFQSNFWTRIFKAEFRWSILERIINHLWPNSEIFRIDLSTSEHSYYVHKFIRLWFAWLNSFLSDFDRRLRGNASSLDFEYLHLNVWFYASDRWNHLMSFILHSIARNYFFYHIFIKKRAQIATDVGERKTFCLSQPDIRIYLFYSPFWLIFFLFTQKLFNKKLIKRFFSNFNFKSISEMRRNKAIRQFVCNVTNMKMDWNCWALCMRLLYTPQL